MKEKTVRTLGIDTPHYLYRQAVATTQNCRALETPVSISVCCCPNAQKETSLLLPLRPPTRPEICPQQREGGGDRRQMRGPPSPPLSTKSKRW